MGQSKRELMVSGLSVDPNHKPRSSTTRKKAPSSGAPLSESLSFAEWSVEYRILSMYRKLVVKGDDASKSLTLIRDAVDRFGASVVERAVRDYAAEAAGSEPRFRKRPFTFFRPDIIEQYANTEPEPNPADEPISSADELKAALKGKKE